jgi:hypothetical protein
MKTLLLTILLLALVGTALAQSPYHLEGTTRRPNSTISTWGT